MKTYSCSFSPSTYLFHRLQNTIEPPFASPVQEHAQQKRLIDRAGAVNEPSGRHDKHAREIVVEAELQPGEHREREEDDARERVPPKVREEPPCLAYVVRLHEHDREHDNRNHDNRGERARARRDVAREQAVDGDARRHVVEEHARPERGEVPARALERHARERGQRHAPRDPPERVRDEHAREEGAERGGERGRDVGRVREEDDVPVPRADERPEEEQGRRAQGEEEERGGEDVEREGFLPQV